YRVQAQPLSVRTCTPGEAGIPQEIHRDKSERGRRIRAAAHSEDEASIIIACLPLCRCGQPLKAHWQTFGPILAPKSNWLGTQLTHGRWSAVCIRANPLIRRPGERGNSSTKFTDCASGMETPLCDYSWPTMIWVPCS